MIKAIAIDDEPKALQIIDAHASNISYLHLISTFTNPYEALDYLNKNEVHLVFLDINMPDLTGLEFSRTIQKKDLNIVFTTAYSEYALESYEVEAVDYLLKPFDFTRFHLAVSKVETRLNPSKKIKKDFFFVNSGSEQCKICYADINYIEGNGNYIAYCLTNKKVLVRSTIKQALEHLPISDFVQIQRSYIVALKHINKLQDNQVYINDTKISIGQVYKKAFKIIIEDL